ncbi:hypothetical protein KKC32_00255 [Patescibacteria group bacterium]|nr:hypothetical protein [Patescibacteria group bacterium]
MATIWTLKIEGIEATIETHDAPHQDEIVAYWLVKQFGTAEFVEKYAKNGVIPVGIGGGDFDEHPANCEERKKNECAATLVAKALGVDERPELQAILKATLQEDTGKKRDSNPLAFSAVITAMNAEDPSGEMAVAWIFQALNAKYSHAKRFWGESLAEYEKSARIEELVGPRGNTLKMALIESDNLQLAPFSRSKPGGHCAVAVVKNSAGQVQILTNQYYRLKVEDIVRVVRFMEMENKKFAPKLRQILGNWKILSSAGTLSQIPEWFYDEQCQALYNGGPTHRDVPATSLTIKQICEAVRIGLNIGQFEPERHEDCTNGMCKSSPDTPCPWYAFGLIRCRKLRFEANHGDSGISERW